MSSFFLRFTVFLTGMAVMAIELTASRLLAPYFGASLFVWTNIIGVVLLALSLGYYFGGKLADRNRGKTAQKVLYPLILLTGIFVTLIPFIGKPIFLFAYAALPFRNVSVFLVSLIATLLLFTVPFLLLGMVTPLAARISIKKVSNAGSVIGSLYAFSTAGSIVGTFLPVLFTIPFLGSRETFFVFGGLLMLLGIIGMRRMALLGFLMLPIALGLTAQSIHASKNLEFEGESIYNYIRVHKAPDGSRSLLTNEGLGIQSLYHPYRPLTGYYWDKAAVLPAINSAGKDFLIIGSAGGTSARSLHYFFPDLALFGVDIDPLMIRVARRFFGMDKLPIALAIEDGRMFLARQEKSYDFIMVDVYKDELYIPFHVSTREFFELVKKRLTENGSMVMNIASLSRDSAVAMLLKNTVTAVFPFVYEWRAENSYNSLLFAFQQKPDFEKAQNDELGLELRMLLASVFPNLKKLEFDPGRDVATDNKSALEFLTEKMVVSEVL